MEIYYVRVHLEQRILFGHFGFTSCIEYFASAETPELAGIKTIAYVEGKYKVPVSKVFPTLAAIQEENKYEFLTK